MAWAYEISRELCTFDREVCEIWRGIHQIFKQVSGIVDRFMDRGTN